MVTDRRLAAVLVVALLMLAGLGALWLGGSSAEAPPSIGPLGRESEAGAPDVGALAEDAVERTAADARRSADTTSAPGDAAVDGEPVPLASILGVLVDEVGHGIEGAGLDLARGAMQIAGTTTDALGRFEFEELEPGHYIVSARRGPSWSRLGREFVRAEELSGDQLASLRITDAKEHALTIHLVRPATLLVRVVTPESSEISLRVEGPNISMHWASATETKSEKKFDRLRPGEYTVRLELDGPDPIPRSVQLRAGESREIEIRADDTSGALLLGRLVGTDLEAIAGHSMRVLDEDGTPFDSVARDVSTSDGTFTIGRLAPGRYILDIDRRFSGAAPRFVQGSIVFDVGKDDVDLGDILIAYGDGWAIAGTLVLDEDWATRTLVEDMAMDFVFKVFEPVEELGRVELLDSHLRSVRLPYTNMSDVRQTGLDWSLHHDRLPDGAGEDSFDVRLHVELVDTWSLTPSRWHKTVDVTIERGKCTTVDLTFP